MKIDEMMNKVICGEAIETMKSIPDKAIDMILCDLPYGTTACSWDTIIPFEPLWEAYKRIIKDNGAIVLTASQPFTSALVMSNTDMFKYEWIYKKRCASNFAQAKYAPMKEHEEVLIFAKGKVNFYPQKEERQGSGGERVKHSFRTTEGNYPDSFMGKIKEKHPDIIDELRYPSSIQEFNNRAKGDRGLHPTQKPLKLFEYLIKTYTNENDLVLDNCCGSGTTGRACKNLNRRFIQIELDPTYAHIAEDRLKQGVLNF